MNDEKSFAERVYKETLKMRQSTAERLSSKKFSVKLKIVPFPRRVGDETLSDAFSSLQWRKNRTRMIRVRASLSVEEKRYFPDWTERGTGKKKKRNREAEKFRACAG